MTDLQRRRFNQREKTALYLAADGKCEACGAELEPGWHADHRDPYSKGGKTDVINGQALCPPCNLKKGNSVADRIQLRDFQQRLVDVTLDRIAAGERLTVAWVNAGSGKTLGWLHVANELYRQGRINGVVCLVPRLNLRKQAELDWRRPPGALGADDLGGFMHMYAEPRLGLVVARDNKHKPLTEKRHAGYITCYASLVSDPGVHFNWARERGGKFLLVCDEAQFLGVDNDEGGGTAAGQYVKQLAGLAFHTMLLTGTPERSDRKPLALAKYTEPGADGMRNLEWHVRATYQEGVAGGYLRPVQYNLFGGEGRFTDGEEFQIDELEQNLGAILREPNVWQPLVDATIDRLQDIRRLDRRYRALISTSTQDHAEEVTAYIKKWHGERPMLAVSRNGDAHNVLDAFREGAGDVLVTVSMAYIGYDCKQLSVLGLLTASRWDGYLAQLIARVLRMWPGRPADEQTAYILGPADPKLTQYCQDMRVDAEKGLRERRRIERAGGGLGRDPFDREVDDVRLTDEFALGLRPSQDMSAIELPKVRHLKTKLAMTESEAKLAEFAREMEMLALASPGEAAVRQFPAQPRTVTETEEEQRNRLSGECRSRMTQLIILRHNVDPKDRGKFEPLIRILTSTLNKRQRVQSTKNASPAQLEERIAVLDIWIEEAKGTAS